MQKTGYFLIKYPGKDEYMSYDEYYAKSDSYKEHLRQQQDSGRLRLYCACRECEELGLFITRNNVIRVRENGQQSRHEKSCPKSEGYARWLKEHQAGTLMSETGRFCFDVNIPTGMAGGNPDCQPAYGTGSGSTGGVKKRANARELVCRMISIAWQKQTWSIKKQIGQAHRDGKKPEWEYKTGMDFLRLFYGAANDVDIMHNGSVGTLASICYNPGTFYKADFRRKFLFYAKVEGFGIYKPERKYQYITVLQPGNKEGRKAAVRVLTSDYETLTMGMELGEGENCMLAGYVRHDVFNNDGEQDHWITLLKGYLIFVADNGMYLSDRNMAEKGLLDMMCRRHILFSRPVLPLENYGGEIPVLVVEQLYGRDIIIDICKSARDRKKKEGYAVDNPEYDIMLYGKGDDPETIIGDLFGRVRDATIRAGCCLI